jgi:hypothetical protein
MLAVGTGQIRARHFSKALAAPTTRKVSLAKRTARPASPASALLATSPAIVQLAIIAAAEGAPAALAINKALLRADGRL